MASSLAERFRLSPRWQARLLMALVLYLTLFGGPVVNLVFGLRVFHHALMTLLIGGWLVTLLRRREPLPATPLDWPVAAQVIVFALATAFALDPRISLEAFWRIGLHTLLFYLIVDLMRRHGHRVMLEPVLFAAAAVSLIGLIEFASWYLGLPWLPMFRQGWLSIGGLAHPIPPVIYRLGFTMSGPTALSAYLGLVIPVGLGWLIATRSTETRRGLVLWLIAALVVQGLSFSRGGLLSLAVSLPSLGALILLADPARRAQLGVWLRDWRVRAALAVAFALVLAFGLAWMRTGLSDRRAGDTERLDLWRTGWRIGLDDPLTGVGPYGFGRAMRSYRDPKVTDDRHRTADNYPLTVWAEAGLPGLLTLFWLVGAIAWVGYRRWRGAEGWERVRVAAICAALLGFGVHNLVDAFTDTPHRLPGLVFAAYLVMPFRPEPRLWGGRLRRALPGVLLALVVLSAGGWAVADLAHYHFSRAVALYDRDDLEGALAEIDAARRIDPAMGYYAVQRAQILGELAAADGSYLDQALDAYQTALAFEGTFDLSHANYAALLAQSGDPRAALDEMQQARRINPREPRYTFWVGMFAGAAGEETTAREAYLEALEMSPAWVGSPFWEGTPLRAASRNAFLQAQGAEGLPLDALAALPDVCWPFAPERWAASAEAADLECRGEVALRFEDDPASALPWLSRAIDADPAYPRGYVARAEAYLALGDREAAERDARTAIFLGDGHGYYVLGRLAEAEGDLEAAIEAYAAGGPLIVQPQNWDVTVYMRRGSLFPLPQLDAPGPSRYDFASWMALAGLYTAQGRDEDARVVYDAIHALDPYFSE
ncbi:MAG TPA: hypothetical protein ENI95_06940 [Chloroflexi bacterium]|nr:hypothetical protein [Chloroflexota bacterium]